jgi:hypothetical protein
MKWWTLLPTPRFCVGYAMNVEAVRRALRDFTRTHRAAFSVVAARESQLLELAAIVAVELHYRSNGYSSLIRSPEGTGTFVVKTSTRGHPAKYSSILFEKDGERTEAHMNLLVRGAHDEGIYCVDVGIVQAAVVPEKVDRKVKWVCAPNDSLLSLVEAKRLNIYPMLLAQFVGIVHEIKPRFLGAPTPSGFSRDLHLPPTLIALGHFSGNSKTIVEAYPGRSITICIAENFDMRLAANRKGTSRSPLYWDDHGEADEARTGGAVEVAAPSVE